MYLQRLNKQSLHIDLFIIKLSKYVQNIHCSPTKLIREKTKQTLNIGSQLQKKTPSVLSNAKIHNIEITQKIPLTEDYDIQPPHSATLLPGI